MANAVSSELRRAMHSLMRSPTVTISAILCLALGIGATAAISSAVYRALLQPLPFPNSERLMAVHRVTPNSGPQGTWPHSIGNYGALARGSKQFEGLAAMGQSTVLLQLSEGGVQLAQRDVTGNFFALLGARAFRGRLLTPADDQLEAPLVTVASYEFWSTRLGGDPAAIGRTFTVDGKPTTLIGVLPPRFRVPHGFNQVSADLWSPSRFTPEQLGNRGSNFLQLLGRLAPGATQQSAEAEMKTLFEAIVASNPGLNGETVRVAPIQADGLAAIRTPMLLLFGAVMMVLLIAATNVAALLLARGVQRRREMAVRTALGASPYAVMRPVMLESALIAFAGVIGGLVLALVGVRSIGALAAARVPQLADLTIDARVIIFAGLLALVVALICGAVPAWRAASVDPQDALRAGRGAGGAREHQRALRTLVIAEITLSVVLLIGSGLVLKGFASLMSRDPGFATDRILVVNVVADPAKYGENGATSRLLDPLIQSVSQLPGVAGAGSINLVPYQNWGWNSNVRYEGQPGDDPARQPLVEFRRISPEFFNVTQQRLLSGRTLSAADDGAPTTPQVVVVNQALVKRDFNGQDPVGKRFHISDTTFATIVGVVSDIRNVGPFADPAPEMYSTYAQSGPQTTFPLMVRATSGDPLALTSAVRNAVRAIDPTAALGDFRVMPDVISSSLGRPRFYLVMLSTFAGVALVLALAGLYGVLSYAVAQRTREMGIRVALGSSRATLIALVTKEGLKLVAVGLVLGAIASYNVRKWLATMIYGVSPVDLATWGACVALMLLAAMAAVFVPAWRAAKVNPIIAIQTE